MREVIRKISVPLYIELAIILTIAIGVYALSYHYDFFERMVTFSREHEDWELDEIFMAVFLSSFTLSVMLCRVIKHLQAEFIRRKKAEDKIRMMALLDDLTGLPNRALCHDRLEHVVVHSKRHNKQAAVLFIDLDSFKSINDSFGHHAGDELLQHTADRLSRFVREDDTLARISGDEFVIIVQSINNAMDVTNLAAKLLSVMEKPFVLKDAQTYISCSIGIAIFPADAQDADTLLQSADTAMYHAKRKGKNTFEFFSPKLDEQAKKRLQISTHLRKALANKEFYLNFQPIMDVRTGEITGCEALLRWDNPTLGKVGPDEFIPVVEETGMILSLGDWVLMQACHQNMRWQRAGFDPIIISVNMSARQLWQENYAESVQCILDETGMAPQYLELELTESTIMEDINMAMKTLEKLKALGVSLALDDFGTGYSSISHLRRLNLHRLKIDRSFICDIPEDKEDVATTHAILSLAENLDLKVTAEGIEKIEQWAFLKQTHCDSMQGYYFSRPLSASDFESLLVEKLNSNAWLRSRAD